MRLKNSWLLMAMIGMGSAISAAAFAGDEEADFFGMPSGRWQVNRMVCNGEEANEATRHLYTGDNSISVVVRGRLGAFVDVIDGCKKVIPLKFDYPQQGLVNASFNGPIQCLPANCDPGCGLDLPVTVQYRYRVRLNTLYWLSIGNGDTNCTQGGQEDPIFYTMRRRFP